MPCPRSVLELRHCFGSPPVVLRPPQGRRDVRWEWKAAVQGILHEIPPGAYRPWSPALSDFAMCSTFRVVQQEWGRLTAQWEPRWVPNLSLATAILTCASVLRNAPHTVVNAALCSVATAPHPFETHVVASVLTALGRLAVPPPDSVTKLCCTTLVLPASLSAITAEDGAAALWGLARLRVVRRDLALFPAVVHHVSRRPLCKDVVLTLVASASAVRELRPGVLRSIAAAVSEGDGRLIRHFTRYWSSSGEAPPLSLLREVTTPLCFSAALTSDLVSFVGHLFRDGRLVNETLSALLRTPLAPRAYPLLLSALHLRPPYPPRSFVSQLLVRSVQSGMECTTVVAMLHALSKTDRHPTEWGPVLEQVEDLLLEREEGVSEAIEILLRLRAAALLSPRVTPAVLDLSPSLAVRIFLQMRVVLPTEQAALLAAKATVPSHLSKVGFHDTVLLLRLPTIPPSRILFDAVADRLVFRGDTQRGLPVSGLSLSQILLLVAAHLDAAFPTPLKIAKLAISRLAAGDLEAVPGRSLFALSVAISHTEGLHDDDAALARSLRPLILRHLTQRVRRAPSTYPDLLPAIALCSEWGTQYSRACEEVSLHAIAQLPAAAAEGVPQEEGWGCAAYLMRLACHSDPHITAWCLHAMLDHRGAFRPPLLLAWGEIMAAAIELDVPHPLRLAALSAPVPPSVRWQDIAPLYDAART
eukprot:Sspe_Gene.52518::Locus_29091_Transcript_2_2_Confidence_0.667_Length_2141::g.52518::m.52518